MIAFPDVGGYSPVSNDLVRETIKNRICLVIRRE